ncbi:MAG: Tim44/TimA family putative adaptor protein [Pseudomonadota bacterium]|nr:Tim44/TimA family putative adaptor protein [Pseudomonadota bacterium]
MGNPFDPLNVILLLIAIFGFIRLRMTLGKRTGNEEPLSPKKHSGQIKQDIEKFSKPKKINKPKNKDDVLLYLENNLNSFDKNIFIDGACNAYEIILKNYAEGNLKKIKNIISKEVYKGFNEALSGRNEKKHKLTNELIAFDKAEIINATIERKSALITVEFYTRLITFVLDENQELVEGNKDNPVSVVDQWIFKKPLSDKGPSWQLISTQSEG